MCLKIEASGKPVAKGDTPLKGTYYGVINDLCGACGQGILKSVIQSILRFYFGIIIDRNCLG